MAAIEGNIFFVGLMGAGKTTIGKLLAKKLKKTFFDTDHEIEKKLGVKVSVIFELEGEEGFRKREAQVIDELSQKKDIILATGGGAVLSEENRALLKERGKVIYLIWLGELQWILITRGPGCLYGNQHMDLEEVLYWRGLVVPNSIDRASLKTKACCGCN